MLANIVVDTFLQGGWVMWPILATFFLALCVILDRVVWWLRFQATLRPAKQEQARDAIGTGDFADRLEPHPKHRRSVPEEPRRRA